MFKLTNTMKEKLNDSKLITEIAEYILKNKGIFDFEFVHDPKIDDETLSYSFEDLPNKKIFIRGYGHFPEEIEEVAFKKYPRQSKLISSFLFETRNFKSHFDNLFIYSKLDPLTYSIVFSSSFDKNNRQFLLTKFKKGFWQDYLAQIYLSSLGELNLKSPKNNILL